MISSFAHPTIGTYLINVQNVQMYVQVHQGANEAHVLTRICYFCGGVGSGTMNIHQPAEAKTMAAMLVAAAAVGVRSVSQHHIAGRIAFSISSICTCVPCVSLTSQKKHIINLCGYTADVSPTGWKCTGVCIICKWTESAVETTPPPLPSPPPPYLRFCISAQSDHAHMACSNLVMHMAVSGFMLLEYYRTL